MHVPVNAQIGRVPVYELATQPYSSGELVRGVLDEWTHGLGIDPQDTLIAAANVGNIAAHGFGGHRFIRAVPMADCVPESDSAAPLSIMLNGVLPYREEPVFGRGLLALDAGKFKLSDTAPSTYHLRWNALSISRAVRAAILVHEVRVGRQAY